jgi:hypothetical protein
VKPETEGIDEIIQLQGWKQNPDGRWAYVADESKISLAYKKRVQRIASLLDISFQAALEYCDSLDVW